MSTPCWSSLHMYTPSWREFPTHVYAFACWSSLCTRIIPEYIHQTREGQVNYWLSSLRTSTPCWSSLCTSTPAEVPYTRLRLLEFPTHVYAPLEFPTYVYALPWLTPGWYAWVGLFILLTNIKSLHRPCFSYQTVCVHYYGEMFNLEHLLQLHCIQVLYFYETTL